ncbi:MAG TPA: riboflavin synthase [Gemmatimonadaceae bacterium]|nr:riboflavin synthase [Gemmatimonadaceae bacterium]
MFTGLIDDVGTIERVETTAAGRTFTIRCGYADLADGESIAVNGACLTVREHGEGWVSVAAVSTSLDRTAMGGWRAGLRVNLERALRAGDRLGGHLVQGHVDGVGKVLRGAMREDALLIDIRVPPDLFALLVPLGSVAVDGVSLTVNALPAEDVLQISLIEYTRRVTTLGDARPGTLVHLEADVIAKYVHRLMEPYRATRPN